MSIKNSVGSTEDTGIYKIVCKDCDEFYIGQSARFNDRIKEHRRDIVQGDERKCIFKHVRDFNHAIDWEESKIIYKMKSWIERNIVESIIIKATFNININDRLGMYSIDHFVSEYIRKELKLRDIF